MVKGQILLEYSFKDKYFHLLDSPDIAGIFAEKSVLFNFYTTMAASHLMV